mmetsp:Transcript_103534/g.291411  ORF Transcript_103534/g.291411 Transcript_103534/m.291411 type:complete len:171 (-) Transcript_103534:151-663(-)
MCYLHGFDPPIIHRDLKSLNLLLANPVVNSHDMPNIKLSDFGLSRLKDSTMSCVMTRAVGTFHWMAPEVNNGSHYDEKCDVYSYAMIMYEIVCRMVPFEDLQDLRFLALQVANGERPSFDACPVDCPKMLMTLMKVCWHQDPFNRPDFQHVRRYLDMVVEAASDSLKAQN